MTTLKKEVKEFRACDKAPDEVLIHVEDGKIKFSDRIFEENGKSNVITTFRDEEEEYLKRNECSFSDNTKKCILIILNENTLEYFKEFLEAIKDNDPIWYQFANGELEKVIHKKGERYFYASGLDHEEKIIVNKGEVEKIYFNNGIEYNIVRVSIEDKIFYKAFEICIGYMIDDNLPLLKELLYYIKESDLKCYDIGKELFDKRKEMYTL